MRETTNLKLTQFDGTDVPNWLDQYNSDNLKIDTAFGEQAVKNTEFLNTTGNLQTQITNNRNQIDENTQDIANTKKDVANIRNGSSTSLADIDKKFIVTDSQITGLKNKVGTADFTNVGSSITEALGNTEIEGNASISADLKTLHDESDTIGADVTRVKSDLNTLTGRVDSIELREVSIINEINLEKTEASTNHVFALNDGNELENDGIYSINLYIETTCVGTTRLTITSVKKDSTISYLAINENYAENKKNTFCNISFLGRITSGSRMTLSVENRNNVENTKVKGYIVKIG